MASLVELIERFEQALDGMVAGPGMPGGDRAERQLREALDRYSGIVVLHNSITYEQAPNRPNGVCRNSRMVSAESIDIDAQWEARHAT